MRLQHQLTLSHILAMLISLCILGLLLVGGYRWYETSVFSARWLGEMAADYANELGYRLQGLPPDEKARVAQSYIPLGEQEIIDIIIDNLSENFSEGLPSEFDSLDIILDDVDHLSSDTVFDFDEHDFLSLIEAPPFTPDSPVFIELSRILEGSFAPDSHDDLLIMFITDPNGKVIASYNPKDSPPGTLLTNTPPQGFKLRQLPSPLPAIPPFYYHRSGTYISGQAPIITPEGEHIGWLYQGLDDQYSRTLISEILDPFIFFALAALLIVAIVSAIISRWLAHLYSRRIARITQASSAFAKGEHNARIELRGNDELTQLSTQFNLMADQLAKQMQALRSLAEHNAQLAQESEGLARLEERQHLARELHDAVKQQLFGLHLSAGSALSMTKHDPEAVLALLKHIAHISRDLLSEMDNIIHQLRPASLQDQGLAEALKALTNTWAKGHHIPLQYQVVGTRELPLAYEQALYRIAQEGLSNVLKHARATHVSVTLSYTLDDVTLTIYDDGVGFDPTVALPPTSFGLVSIRDRAARLGGTVTLISEVGKGTTLTARFPQQALDD